MTYGQYIYIIIILFCKNIAEWSRDMLLEFKTSNYKSFKDELVFSLVPAPKQKGLDYSILQEKIGKKDYKGLCSAIIYGHNAAGKTNIIEAMDTFKAIVLRGHVRNVDERNTPNKAADFLELIPCSFAETGKPVSFSIKFTTKDNIDNYLIIEYSFVVDLGNFWDHKYDRKILDEKLSINENIIFSRHNQLNVGNLESIRDFLVNGFDKNEESAVALAGVNLNCQELFLMNGFKALFSAKLVSLIVQWLEKKFMVYCRVDSLLYSPNIHEDEKNSILIEENLNNAAACFGITSNALGYMAERDSNKSKLVSIIGNDEEDIAIPADIFESYGTIRFANIFPLVARTLVNGCTLVVDEFDASIHPMALMNIINIFHNDQININHAQLIFNTHNPIFLNSNLYRRDEIKFVERDENTHCSSHYSLSDFGTTGSMGVRQNEDYMKNYFIDRYGAIKDVDFTPIFEKLLTPKRGNGD